MGWSGAFVICLFIFHVVKANQRLLFFFVHFARPTHEGFGVPQTMRLDDAAYIALLYR